LEKTKVIEFAKNKFRLEQITSEGNDPSVTNRSFGTPHDIASMHTASGGSEPTATDTIKKLYANDERENNTGRPEKFGSFERKNKDKILGGDPTGRRELDPKKLTGENRLKKLDLLFTKSKKETKLSLLNEDLLIKDEF
jgi:hypothetical protein